MKPKIYLGIKGKYREVFRTDVTPTLETHGYKYRAVIGPFRTMRGALWARDVGRNSPHFHTVDDAERLSKEVVK